MHTRHFLAAAAAALLACAGHAGAATLASDGQWATFDVSLDLAGSLGWIDIADAGPLTFSFSIAPGDVGTLTVVDAGFGGDTFTVLRGNVALGTTSVATNTYPSNVFLDFDAALADPRYSRGVFTLQSGSYVIGGALLDSALGPGSNALYSTVGGIKLTVAPVPEPATVLSMLAGLALVGATLRRRAV